MKINWSFLAMILCVLIAVGFIAFEIYVWVRYGSLPITEIPAWALFFMFNRNGGG